MGNNFWHSELKILVFTALAKRKIILITKDIKN